MYKKNLDLFHKRIESGTYKINIDNIEHEVNNFCKLVNIENTADINIYKCLLNDVPNQMMDRIYHFYGILFLKL